MNKINFTINGVKATLKDIALLKIDILNGKNQIKYYNKKQYQLESLNVDIVTVC